MKVVGVENNAPLPERSSKFIGIDLPKDWKLSKGYGLNKASLENFLPIK